MVHTGLRQSVSTSCCLKQSRDLMCEFTVLMDGEEIFKGAVYAKVTGTSVSVKDILGTSKKIDNSRIAEVDVTKERLVLARI